MRRARWACTEGRGREGYPPGGEPNQTSRAALLVPGPALRRQPALEGLTPAGFGALSASAQPRLCTGTGEAAARMPGGAPLSRRRPGGGGP